MLICVYVFDNRHFDLLANFTRFGYDTFVVWNSDKIAIESQTEEGKHKGLCKRRVVIHHFSTICFMLFANFYLNQKKYIDSNFVIETHIKNMCKNFFHVVHRLYILQLYGHFPLLLHFPHCCSKIFI